MGRNGVNYKLAFLPPSRILFFSSNSAGLEINLKISSYLASDQVISWMFIIFIECLLRGFFSLLYLCLLCRKISLKVKVWDFLEYPKWHFIMYVHFIMASFDFWVTDLSWFSSFLTASPFWSPSHLSPLAVCSP